MTLARVIVVVVLTTVAMAARWFVRIANQAKGYHREPRPRSVADHVSRSTRIDSSTS